MKLNQKDFNQLSATEILDLIQEEAAEVIQAASKVKRFGHSGYNEAAKDSAETNHRALVREWQDLGQAFEAYMSRPYECTGSVSHTEMIRNKQDESED